MTHALGGTARVFLAAVVLVLLSSLGVTAQEAPADSRRGGETSQYRAWVRMLAAPDMDGRLTGSPGNTAAAHALAAELRTLGYAALPGRDTLLEPYRQAVIRRTGATRVALFASEGAADPEEGPPRDPAFELEPGIDFNLLIREGTTISGTVRAAVSPAPADADAAWIAAHAGRAILINAETFGGMTRNREIMTTLFSPDKGPAAVLLAMPEEMQTMSRGVFVTAGDAGNPGAAYRTGGPVLLQLQHSAARAVVQMNSPEIRIETNYRVETAETVNVVGRIGDGPEPPLLITAHFDGQGRVSEEVHYPSAVDNASGVAVALGLARVVADAGEHRTRPVWIVLFNGEEQGLYGSRAFVAEHEAALEGALVVNIDMVGHSPSAPLSVIPNAGGNALASEVAEALRRGGLAARSAGPGRSDHASFDEHAPAVTIVQAPYPHMHAPTDTAEQCDPALIKELVGALAPYITRTLGYADTASR